MSLHIRSRAAAVLTVLFALPVALIGAGAHDDHDLAKFLVPPPGCPAPCFLGIRPGLTGIAEVEQLLDANPAVQYTATGRNRIDWWLGGRVRGSIHLADDVVRHITIYDIPLGEVWLILGQPDSSQSLGQNATAAGGNVLSIPVMHSSFYTAYDIRVDAPAVCASFWHQTAQIYIAPPAVHAFDITPTDDSQLAVHRRRSCEMTRQFGHRLQVESGAFLNLPAENIK